MTLPTSNPSSLATELVTTHRHDVEDDDIGDDDGADGDDDGADGDDNGADGDDDGADGDDDGADGDDLLIMPMWMASVSMSATKNDQSEDEKYVCQSVCLSRKMINLKQIYLSRKIIIFSRRFLLNLPQPPQQALFLPPLILA